MSKTVPDSDKGHGTPPLRLEWRSPAELAENPRNWRTHPQAQVDALTDVIGEVGWAGACLYNERTGRLIDGHARRKVALEQGCESVPVLVGSWDEATEAKILATLDPLAAMAQADGGKLDALLREVQTGSQPLADMLTSLAEAEHLIPQVPGATSGAGGEVVDDPSNEWGGMPEFEQPDTRAHRQLIVNFQDDEAVQDFARLIGQALTEKTRYVWHPEQKREKLADHAYVTDEDADEGGGADEEP